MAHHQPALKRGLPLLAGLAILVLASLAFALTAGSVELGWRQILGVFAGEADPLASDLVLDLRLPRALSACATGGMLALAGAMMQALLRNPLADPYILGVSGGAAVGALGALMAGLSGYWLSSSAFCGALLSMILVFALARGPGEWSATRLLLTGVVVAAGWGAAISFILAVSPDSTLRGMMFWLLGDLSQADAPGFPLVMLALGMAFGFHAARDLNVLVHGEHKARSLGVATSALRLRLYVASSLLTAVAVTVAGNIGFIGLIAPHILRLAGAHDHRILIPASALLGAAMLTTADTLARTVAAPLQLPVGVITALLGVPLFLYLLRRSA